MSIILAVGMAGQAYSQEEQTDSSEPIVVDPHWSRYQAPMTYPEGTELHIIVRGDTLWDLSNQYLQNPFLWPQLWDANRYIENPHLIYPGDPVRIPEVDVVRPEDVAPGTARGPDGGVPGGPGGPGELGPDGQPLAPGAPGSTRRGPAFIPAFEEIGIQCASYIGDDDDRGFKIFGSEEGDAKDNLSTNDVVYLNHGSSDGISPGEMYYSQRRFQSPGYDNKFTQRTGWLKVIAVQEKTFDGADYPSLRPCAHRRLPHALRAGSGAAAAQPARTDAHDAGDRTYARRDRRFARGSGHTG